MSERFIKFIPNEKSAWLREHHTPLFLLLSLAIERAHWHLQDNELGLMQGDSILGTPKKAGITPKQYTLAIKKGEEFGIWEVVYNKKNDDLNKGQKRTIKGTINCIVVNLKNTMCWDLNFQIKDNQKDEQRTTKGQYTKKEQENKESFICIKETNKEKIVHNSVVNSSLFQNEKVSEEHIESIQSYFDSHAIIVDKPTIYRWLKNHPLEKILDNISYTFSKNNVKNFGAYLETALRDNFAQNEKNRQTNRDFALNFINTKKVTSLKMTKNYLSDENDGQDYQFKLDPELFKDMLERKYG